MVTSWKKSYHNKFRKFYWWKTFKPLYDYVRSHVNERSLRSLVLELDGAFPIHGHVIVVAVVLDLFDNVLTTGVASVKVSAYRETINAISIFYIEDCHWKCIPKISIGDYANKI